MFGKNLKYYRLKSGFSQTELASKIGIKSAAISNYERGERLPDTETIQKLAEVLQVRISDFLIQRDKNLCFEKGEFLKNKKLSKNSQELINDEIREYFTRFFSILEILGGDILPKGPQLNSLDPSEDFEMDAKKLRKYLGISDEGPVKNLIKHLENSGILFMYIDFQGNGFSGKSGIVEGIPYIAVNRQMTPERIRNTIVHELIHLYFNWPKAMEDKELEKKIEAISGAFLFPKVDALRELGIKRAKITSDMENICREYEISLDLLVCRACQCGIISEGVKKGYYFKRPKVNPKEFVTEREKPTLFEQLVLRAVAENEISVQKGAELLQIDYRYIQENSAPFERGIY